MYCEKAFNNNSLKICVCVGVPYEITTYTSDISGAGTSADVYVVLYGRDTCTSQKSLCPNKNDRKKNFDKAKEAKFVIEVCLSALVINLMLRRVFGTFDCFNVMRFCTSAIIEIF